MGWLELAADPGAACDPVEPVDVTIHGPGPSNFGWALAAADLDRDGLSELVVGAPALDGVGGVFVYRGAPGGLEAEPRLHLAGEVQGDRFGWSVGIGDVNGDGWPDVLVVARDLRLDVFAGGPGGPAVDPTWTLPAPSFRSVTVLGDTDGDGFVDGVLTSDGDPARVVVWTGGSDGPSLGPELQWDQALFRMTPASTSPGDLDGDGLADLVVGVTGAGLLQWSGAELPLGAPSWLQLDGAFVVGLASGGDLDQDGVPEVLVSTRGDADDATVSVLPGGVGPATTTWSAPEPEFGAALASIGDLDGDGVRDVAIGSPYYGDLHPTGVLRVYGATSEVPLRSWTVAVSDCQLGARARGLGDVDGDGCDDLAFSDFLADGPNGEEAGRVWVVYGCGPIPPPPPAEPPPLGEDPELGELFRPPRSQDDGCGCTSSSGAAHVWLVALLATIRRGRQPETR